MYAIYIKTIRIKSSVSLCMPFTLKPLELNKLLVSLYLPFISKHQDYIYY